MSGPIYKQENAFSQAVLEHFLATGQPATRADIAKRLGVSPAKAGRLHAELSGAAIDWTTVERSAQSKDYPGFHLRSYKVEAYLPRRETMRRELLNLRRALQAGPDCDICNNSGVVPTKRRNSFTMVVCVCRRDPDAVGPVKSLHELNGGDA